MSTWVWLAAGAEADPLGDPFAVTRTVEARAESWDVLLGQAQRPIEDAARLPADPVLDARLAPERAALDATWAQPVWWVRPGAALGVGTVAPTLHHGDVEPGLVSPRLFSEAAFYAPGFELQVRPRVDLDLAPTSAGFALEQLQVGVRTRDVWFGISKEPRWVGPGRHSSLIWTSNADPLPGAEFHADWRWPGKVDVLGRFGVDVAAGYVPGARDDVTRPGWLLLDLRWAPVPFVELGLTRNAMFGGRDADGPRPIDFGQLLLPTQPHIYGDEDQVLPDTDERLAADVRLTLPFARWVGGPIRYVEAYLQHGGEDTGAQVLPYPQLAGAANLYGAEAAIGPTFFGVERAVLEDDYQRWYVGHRVYHEGWTQNGAPIANPWGGDSHTWWLHAGLRRRDGAAIVARYEHAHQWHVVDLVQDSLFVFPDPEVTRLVGARLMAPIPRGGFVTVDASGGRRENEDALAEADAWLWRVGAALDLGALPGRAP